MNQQSNKTSMYLIIVVVFALAGYQTFMNYKPAQETERHRDYVDGIKQALTASDSAYIKAFYNKLCLVNTTLSQAAPNSKAFSNIDKSKLIEDFQPHICTNFYLESLCGSSSDTHSNNTTQSTPPSPEEKILNSIDVYLGLGRFSQDISEKNWSGSVKSEISNLEKDNYLVLVNHLAIVPPVYYSDTDTYDGGHCKGEIKVVNINNNELVATMSFFAENDDSIKSMHLVDSAMNDKLLDNLILNIQKALNKCTLALFNKPLKTKEEETYK